jgi:hypothetical protein
MTPEWGTALGALPSETQFLLLELEEPGTYGLVLPLIDGDFRATLRPNKWAGGEEGRGGAGASAAGRPPVAGAAAGGLGGRLPARPGWGERGR